MSDNCVSFTMRMMKQVGIDADNKLLLKTPRRFDKKILQRAL